MKKLLVTMFLISALVLCLASCEQVNNLFENDKNADHTHSMSEWTNLSATCTTAGMEERHCTAEGCDYSEKRIAAALGHDESTTPAKAPTCKEVGYDEYVSCSRCDYTTRVDKPALEHNYVNGICSMCNMEDDHEFGEWGNNTATCLLSGTESRTCSSCGFVDTRETVALGHDKVTVEAQAPDCESVGWNEYQKCQREGCVYTTYKEIAATGHNMSEYANNTATCESKGVETAECQNEGCEHTETRETEKLPHEYGEDNKCVNCGHDKYMLPAMPVT